mgnify:CR=1 FL=1
MQGEWWKPVLPKAEKAYHDDMREIVYEKNDI